MCPHSSRSTARFGKVRFQRKPDGTPDGGVHQLFTVVGRIDTGSPGCTSAALPPTDFETQYRNGNRRSAFPLQLFGLGLIEAIQDQTILEQPGLDRLPAGCAGDWRYAEPERQ